MGEQLRDRFCSLTAKEAIPQAEWFASSFMSREKVRA